MKPTEENRQDNFDDVIDYLQYSRVRSINVIPETDFKALVSEVFHTIAENLRKTYGPYGKQVMISDGNDALTTKDGYNTFCALGPSDPFKRKIYLRIRSICDRVNRVVGDGTTSCILLAEKMFNKINAVLNTPDDERNALIAFNEIERDYQNFAKLERDKKTGLIEKLDEESLRNLVSLADNYDTELADILIKAFDPTIEDGEVKSVRNVIVDSRVDPESTTNIKYELKQLPGDYRVRVEMNTDVALSYENWSTVRIALFDHKFTEDDWAKFYKDYDKENRPETIIMASGFSQKFLDNIYATYYCFYECEKNNLPISIKLAIVKGQFVQKEISDLAAVLKTDKIKIEAPIIDHSKLPLVTFQVFEQNCMCFKDVEAPTEYIESVKADMEREDTESFIIKKNYQERIEALSMNGYGDTLLKITGSTNLEVMLIADKITDCTCIVNSAIKYGIVPNMLRYGWLRTGDLINTDDSVFHNTDDEKLKKIGELIEQCIRESIEGLFIDIWRSKYLSTRDDEIDYQVRKFYDGGFFSYDIINGRYEPCFKFPTSPQYDLEVIVAAVSIVKYLITSGAYIFDADLLGKVQPTL